MRALWLLSFLCVAAPAGAQEDITVPPPPPAGTSPPPALPTMAGVPIDVIVQPLAVAAEADLTAGRLALALARTSIVAEVLPEGVPLRVRCEGLRLLATQRMPPDTPAPPIEEVYAPLVAQADFDLRAGQPRVALPRLDFVLARLPPGTPLAARAQQLRQYAASTFAAPPPPSVPPPVAPVAPPVRPVTRSPGGVDHRGTAEIVELYILAAGLGALTGAYIPFVTSNETAAGTTYAVTSVAGAGLLAVGVLGLDLAMPIPSGVPPTISGSIRLGLGHGLLALAVRSFAEPYYGADEAELRFSLVWGGTVAGGLIGLAVGFGLTPTVPEARFVESCGYWGAALGTYIALMTDYQDPVAGIALTLAALDAGLLIGIALAAAGLQPSIGRTLWTDLGFLVGSGVGALVPTLYFTYTDSAVAWPAYGVGMALGGLGGWLLTFFLTEGLDARPQATPDVNASIVPAEGGAILSVSGRF